MAQLTEAQKQKKKQALLKKLKALNQYKRANRIEYFGREGSKLQPNPIQKRLIDAWREPYYKIFAVTGANRIGKTTILSVIGLSCMYRKFLWDDTDLSYLFPHNEPIRVRYIGQDWQSHIKKVVIPELKKWWPQNRKVKKEGNGILPETSWTDIKTGSTLDIMSNYQSSEVHEGASFDVLLVDEPCRREIWIANARGLVDRKGRAMFGMTLLKEAWIHRDIIKRLDENGRPDRSVFSVNGDIHVNVGYGITEEGVRDFEKNLTEDEKQARLKGIPSYMSGLVLKNFSREKNLKRRFEIPSTWMVDIMIDVHPRKPQAILFRATSPQNERYLCYEIWDHGNAEWIADSIIKTVARQGYRVNRVGIDPLSKADSNSEDTMYDRIARALLRHGMVLETASKDKTAGILEINEGFLGPNNEPSLFIFDDLVRTIYEVEGWMYEDKGENMGKPSKTDDDMCENLYRLMLWDTQWVSPEAQDWNFTTRRKEKVDATTGY